jgi:hypothetical protein
MPHSVRRVSAIWDSPALHGWQVARPERTRERGDQLRTFGAKHGFQLAAYGSRLLKIA